MLFASLLFLASFTFDLFRWTICFISLTFCYFNSITSSGRALSSVVSSIHLCLFLTLHSPSSNYAARITFRSNLSASQPFSRPAARTHLNLSPHRHPLRVVPQEYVSAHAPHPLFLTSSSSPSYTYIPKDFVLYTCTTGFHIFDLQSASRHVHHFLVFPECFFRVQDLSRAGWRDSPSYV